MLDRFHKLSEIVAAFAIVGSLIFVGLQMQQNTDAMRVSFVQSSMESWNMHSMTMASDEQLSSAFFGGVYPELQQKFGKIDPVEGQVAVWMNATWHTVETLFFQWQAGYLPDENWQGYRTGMLRSFAYNKTYNEQWISNRDQFSESFRSYGDALKLEAAEVRATMLSTEG